MKKKVLAIASIGGHWMQLLRIVRPLESTFSVAYVSTHRKCGEMVKGNRFYPIYDFNRWNAWKAIFTAIQLAVILIKERPKTVISTGAAPGLLGILLAKILFRDTIWIDSVANVEQLSCCGKISKKIANHVYTQWPDLVDDKVKYAGSIFGDRL